MIGAETLSEVSLAIDQQFLIFGVQTGSERVVQFQPSGAGDQFIILEFFEFFEIHLNALDLQIGTEQFLLPGKRHRFTRRMHRSARGVHLAGPTV